MRGLIISAVLLIVFTLTLLSGLFSTSGGLMVIGFCGLPFVMFALGWAARSAMAGKRIMIVPTDQPAARRTPLRDDSQTARVRRIAAQHTTDGQL